MHTTLEETGEHTVKLTVEVLPDEFGKDLDRAYRSIAQQVKIPGFRKGKVPRPVIDAQVGREAVVAEFLNDSVYTYYMEAVREHDLAPIEDPDLSLNDFDEGKPLKFTAEVEVRPRLELEDYKGVKASRPDPAVSDADVDAVVDRLRDRFAELETVGRAADDGDYVQIDLHATLHGEEVPEASRNDFLYEVGSGVVVPELDTELKGKRKGDILKFNAALPEGAGERAGRELSFQVLLKEVKAKKLLAADDEFAKTASEFDTLDELREDLRDKLLEQNEREADAAVRDRVLDAMVDRVEVDLPESLVDHETEHRVEQATKQAERLGVTLDEMLEIQGWDELRFRADARDHAVRAIKSDLILEAVARAEGLEVSAEDLGTEIAKIAATLGREPRDLAKQLNETGQINALAGDIIRSKALDVLVEHAEIATDDGSSAAASDADSSEDDQGADADE